MDSQSLSIGDALKAIRDDIQAENTLIATRMTWYVTSQAFLLTAYATSWNADFAWPYFFHEVLPLAAVALSVVIQASIFAATWAQDVYIREQVKLVSIVKNQFQLSRGESEALRAYEHTMIKNRTSRAGNRIGEKIHVLVRISPLVLPVGFAMLWLYAYFCAPVI
jgi:tellurite resistance protein